MDESLPKILLAERTGSREVSSEEELREVDLAEVPVVEASTRELYGEYWIAPASRCEVELRGRGW